MDKKIKIYIALFIIIIGLIMYADATKPKPINWFPSYAAKHKIPYGTYVLRNELPKLFPTSSVKDVRQNPYVFLQDTTRKGTYFFLNGFINFDKAEFKKILKFVEKGNDVFLATNGANIDTLGLKTEQIITSALEEKFKLSLLNPSFKKDDFTFDRPATNLIFSEIDTLKSTALGKLVATNKEEEFIVEGINFIKYEYGKGSFYFHTAPLLFTNYNILKDENYKYVENVLSYLDKNKQIFWDTHYKTGKSKMTSPMQYVLNSKSLKWAYYMVLIGVLFFVIFKSKRVQRFIPVIIPLKNQTIAFTRTIANMYYEKSEHKNIATHKINYFLDYIRTKLHVPTNVINESFYKHLAARSGNTIADVKDLFMKIEVIKKQKNITKEQLITLNNKIESFIGQQSIS